MLATIYITLSKIIIVLDADIHSLVPVRVLPKVFIFGDIISLAAQLTGKSNNTHHFLSSSNNKQVLST